MERTHFWILVLLYFAFFIVYSYLHYAIWQTKSIPKYARSIIFGVDIFILVFICNWLIQMYNQKQNQEQDMIEQIDGEDEEVLAHWDTSAHRAFQSENEALLRRQLAPPQIQDPRLRNHYIEETKQAYEQLAEFNEMRL